MIMGLKKKKHMIILTLCMVTCFSLYQLYFFRALMSEDSKTYEDISVVDRNVAKEKVHLRSEKDKYINDDGILRGVLQQNMVKYRPDSKNEFKCLNSEQRIQFDRVNDEYCDCDDGTDEPSTNACIIGIFNCHLRPKDSTFEAVPSSRVNDGICDCCDGSDEFIIKSDKLLSRVLPKYNYRRHFVTQCIDVC